MEEMNYEEALRKMIKLLVTTPHLPLTKRDTMYSKFPKSDEFIDYINQNKKTIESFELEWHPQGSMIINRKTRNYLQRNSRSKTWYLN